MTPFVLLYFSVPNTVCCKIRIIKNKHVYKAVGPENIKYSKDSLVKTSMFCKQISACFRWRCRATTISTDMRSQHLEGVCKPHRDAYGAYTARS